MNIFIWYYIFACVGAYLIGSLNFGLLISKSVYKTDIRTKGSGNAGATNTLRTFGKKAAVAVLIGDALKGVVAVLIGKCIANAVPEMKYCMFLTAFFVVAGHIFPVYFKFKGGKGVATLLGVVIAVEPLLAAALLVFFVAVVAISRMVSLGSLLSAAICPLVTYLIFNAKGEEMLTEYVIFTSAMALLLVITHRKNIVRIVKGEESKLGSKKIKTEE